MSLGSNFRVKKILHRILTVANVVLRYVTVSFNTYIERKKNRIENLKQDTQMYNVKEKKYWGFLV